LKRQGREGSEGNAPGLLLCPHAKACEARVGAAGAAGRRPGKSETHARLPGAAMKCSVVKLPWKPRG
jgi:hypothetical protein